MTKRLIYTVWYIDKVMHEIFKDHAKKCHINYLQKYHSKKLQLDGLVTKQVTNIVNTILDKSIRPSIRIYKSSKYLFDVYVAQEFSIEDCFGQNYLKGAILNNAKSDPDVEHLQEIENELTGQGVVHVDKIKELVRKYLIKPCQPFVAELGPDLFIPARLDAKFYYDVEQSNRDYYLDWVGFMICKALVENEAAVQTEVIMSVGRD